MQAAEPAQDDAEHAELQESVYTNDTQGCYIAGMRPHEKKKFPSPNTLTGIDHFRYIKFSLIVRLRGHKQKK